MKIFSLLFLFLLSISCNNKTEKEKTTPKESSKKDTVAITKTENTINPYAPVDVSPMDMCYYPADYPKLKMAKTTTVPPMARVVYSRPHLQGRQLFLDVLKYDEPWRLGANESTEIDFYTDASIQDKKIQAGRYVIYCIPHPDNWTIILNSNIDSWGLQPDTAKDIARFIVPVKQTNNHLEFYTMIFEKTDTRVNLVMAWDNLEARLPIAFGF